MSLTKLASMQFNRRSLLGGVSASVALVWPVWAQARMPLGGRTISVGAPNGLFTGLQSYPKTLALEDREVVLTLDDGPLPGPTDRVLDALSLHGAKATFFMIGRNAAASPAQVRRMAADGHTLAHHTMNHPWTLRQRSFQTGVREIEDGIRAVQAAQGLHVAGIATPFFRFPGFADTPELNEWLATKGIAVFGSDVWASDWNPMSPDRQLSLIMTRLNRARKGVILLHDVVGQTAAMFPAFLQALSDGGYRIANLKPGPFEPATQTGAPSWRSLTERIIAGRR